ncbi:hypothetical protein QBC40DRAFT_298316 [Triangularia verruculosa]|uniref:Uncharacterized protein n=1 Tax=Triangularia verruculosa TaxID=2587418 RepID=A0AAN6XDN0_9PEZI|nr:hypothetical protein QBC40DRAFT_298316 [Triangularia verruculosa]
MSPTKTLAPALLPPFEFTPRFPAKKIKKPACHSLFAGSRKRAGSLSPSPSNFTEIPGTNASEAVCSPAIASEERQHLEPANTTPLSAFHATFKRIQAPCLRRRNSNTVTPAEDISSANSSSKKADTAGPTTPLSQHFQRRHSHMARSIVSMKTGAEARRSPFTRAQRGKLLRTQPGTGSSTPASGSAGEGSASKPREIGQPSHC